MDSYASYAEPLEPRRFLSAASPRSAFVGPIAEQASSAGGTSLSSMPPVQWMRFNWETEHSISVQFSTDMASSLNAGTVRVTDLGTGQVVPWCLFFPRIESPPGQPTLATWQYFGGIMTDGNYRADVLDAVGNVESAHDFFVMAGDANHDGAINFDDYVAIDQGYNGHLSGFSHGDFNYDGVVDYDDYVIIDSAFNGGPYPPG